MGNFLDVVHAEQTRPFLGPLQRFGVGDAFRGDEPVERPAHAQLPRQRPRVDALDAGNAVLLQVLGQRRFRPPVAHDRRQLADDEARHVRLPGFDILPVHAVVADERVGHRDDLPLVGRVGQDLLVAGHRGVEANLAAGRGARAKACAVKHRTVFEGQNRFHSESSAGYQAFAGSACSTHAFLPPTIVATALPRSGQP